MATFCWTLHKLSLLSVCVERKKSASNTEMLSIKMSAYQFRVNAQISLWDRFKKNKKVFIHCLFTSSNMETAASPRISMVTENMELSM